MCAPPSQPPPPPRTHTHADRSSEVVLLFVYRWWHSSTGWRAACCAPGLLSMRRPRASSYRGLTLQSRRLEGVLWVGPRVSARYSERIRASPLRAIRPPVSISISIRRFDFFPKERIEPILNRFLTSKEERRLIREPSKERESWYFLFEIIE